MVVENFIGPSNTEAAITAAPDRTINMYEELVDPGFSGKGKTWLRAAPGLSIYSSLGGPGIEVSCLFSQNDRTFAVAGDTCYEIYEDGTPVNYGTVATDPRVPVTMCSNGSAGGQIFITSGLNGYIFNLNTNTLTLIADIDFPQGEAVMSEFMDGYFLVAIAESRAFQISALEDGTSWDALDIAERSEASDDLRAIKRSHREIWVLGELTGEVWYDSGDPLFPFAPVQGVFIEIGCWSAFSVQRIGNTVMWLGANDSGMGMVWIADGYTPKRVSTFNIEDMLQVDLPTFYRSWVYQERGHEFYVLKPLDRVDTTPVFDLTMGRWDERGLLDPTSIDEDTLRWFPNRPVSHCFAYNKHLVGDGLTGTIYEQSVAILGMELATA